MRLVPSLVTLTAFALVGVLPARPVESTACPDLTGTWTYPGRGPLPVACPELWQTFDLLWPSVGGFLPSGLHPHPIRIIQDRCESLTIAVRLEGYLDDQGQRGPDVEHEILLNLRPQRGRTVTRGERSLVWRQTYTPAGFRFPPWRREVMTVELAVGEDGGLEYTLRQETRGGKRLMAVRCQFEQEGSRR